MEGGPKYLYCCSLTPYQIQLQSSVGAWSLTQGISADGSIVTFQSGILWLMPREVVFVL